MWSRDGFLVSLSVGVKALIVIKQVIDTSGDGLADFATTAYFDKVLSTEPTGSVDCSESIPSGWAFNEQFESIKPAAFDASSGAVTYS